MYKETADDLNKKYHNTFAKYQGILAFITSFAEAGSTPGAQVSGSLTLNGERGVVTVPNVVAEDLEPIVFDATFINNTNFRADAVSPPIPAVLVQRKPRRQWKRGLCTENTRVTCPMHSLYASMGRNLPEWQGKLDMVLIRRLLAPTYPTWKDAIKLVDRYQAIAIGPLFAITLSTISTSRYLLASHFGFIGECGPDSIWVKHSPALQEVRDFVQRNKLPVAVEVV